MGIAKHLGEEFASKGAHSRHTGAHDADMALKCAPVSQRNVIPCFAFHLDQSRLRHPPCEGPMRVSREKLLTGRVRCVCELKEGSQADNADDGDPI